MIEKLTQGQIEKMSEYVDKWLKIGFSTERVNRDTAKWISDYCYTKIVGKKPVPIIIMSSPLYSWLAVCLLSQV